MSAANRPHCLFCPCLQCFSDIVTHRKSDPNTLETAYKVAICPRGDLPYKQIYLINDHKVTLKRPITASKIPTL